MENYEISDTDTHCSTYALDSNLSATLSILLNRITCVKSQIALDMLTVISFKINPHEHGQMWPCPTVLSK